jgi:hypothetical protein
MLESEKIKIKILFLSFSMTRFKSRSNASRLYSYNELIFISLNNMILRGEKFLLS